MECYQLRQDASHLQSSLMKLRHQQQLKRLNTLTKSTMTDQSLTSSSEYTPPLSANPSSITVTDSATQVDLALTRSPGPPEAKWRRPELRDAQVSPLHPWTPPDASISRKPPSSTPAKANGPLSYLALAGVSPHRRSPTRRLRQRTYSDGEILLHRRKAKAALSSVRNLSRSLQEGLGGSDPAEAEMVAAGMRQSLSGKGRGVKSGRSVGRSANDSNVVPSPWPNTHEHGHRGASSPRHSEHCQRVEGAQVKGSKKRLGGGRMVVGPHKCLWQQQVKTLQQRVKTLAKQV